MDSGLRFASGRGMTANCDETAVEEPTPPSVSRWQRIEKTCGPVAHFFETSAVIRLAAVFAGLVGFFIVVGTAIQIVIDLQDRREEREARRQDSIDQAWTRLLAPAVGNTGKGWALTVLSANEMSLDGVDLSCKSIGRWDEPTQKCIGQVIFDGAILLRSTNGEDLSSPVISIAATNSIEDISLRDAKISNMEIRDFAIKGDFERSYWEFVVARNSWISGNFDNAQFHHVDFTGSIVEFSSKIPTIVLANFSNATVPWIEETYKENDPIFDTIMASIAAWADYPPLTVVDLHRDFSRELRPVNDTILNAMRLCAPPIDEAGKIIPLEDRKIDLTTPSAEDNPCTLMSPEEAKKAYPAAYANRAAFLPKHSVTRPKRK
jgi:hypothetical protein